MTKVALHAVEIKQLKKSKNKEPIYQSLCREDDTCFAHYICTHSAGFHAITCRGVPANAITTTNCQSNQNPFTNDLSILKSNEEGGVNACTRFGVLLN